ncbi:MAG TPA: hypothetical protein VJN93_09200 [Candidatus Acidoferrum sp.]|nr:hypothetical protein [Candidatus Acidoferrum sp.]
MKKRCVFFVACLLVAIATTARAQTSGVNNAELNGDYAFTFSGFTGSSGSAAIFAAVGRFTANGAGNVTNGVLDSNGGGGNSILSAQPFTGTYTIGSDHRGMLSLNIAGGTQTFAFIMMANGNAQFIGFDAAGRTGISGSGTIEKADRTAFSAARITGDYAFGMEGFNASGTRISFAGRFTSDGAGTLGSAVGDINAGGTFGPATFTSSTYALSDVANGRGTTSWSFVFNSTSFALNFVFYVVNSRKLLVLETDSIAGGFPLLNGAVVQQQTPAGGFSNASLNGTVVIYLTGRAVCTSGAASAPDVVIGSLVSPGAGSLTLTYDENCGGVISSFAFTGTDAVTPNGRVAMIIDGGPEVAYLTAPNQLIFIAAEPAAYFGPGNPQSASALTNGSFVGNYAGFSTDPVVPSVTTFTGQFSANGASPTGNLAGALDVNAAGGLTPGTAFAGTYSISSSPTNGRGTVTVTIPSGVNAIAYVISPTKVVMFPTNDANPSLWVFETSSSATPPPTATLTSLTLNPSNVVGGRSSSGTVTLSAPAPAGGVVVSLSSSNPAAAQVPSSASVTIPAAATSASFTITTSAVNSSTSVTISAALGGTTRTALLTVTPPPPGITSVTLNPSSVVGGLQTSTGTVTLSRPAPAGGVVVSLSSSNPAAAQVPSSGSVTVPAGAKSASFTVTTSIVLISTSAQVSASFNGTTRTATLTILL